MGLERLPVNARPGHPGSNPSGFEPALFKHVGVPRFETCGAQEDFTAGLQGAVQCLYLGEGLRVLGTEPVHAVHDLLLVVSAFVDGVSCFGGGGSFGLTTAWLRVPGAIRQITSWSSSV